MRALILATNELFGFLAAAAFGIAGVAASVAGCTRWAPSRFSRHCRRYLRTGEKDLREGGGPFLEQLGRQCRILGIDVLVPADLPTARMLVARRGSLPARSFPLPDQVDTLDLLHDKERFARLLQEIGLPHPETRVLRRPEEAASLELPYPVIAKPADGEGGKQVRRIETPAELARYLEEHAPARSIVQTFVEGEDVDVSLLADRGRVAAWTIQRRDRGREGLMHFLEDDRLLGFARRVVERVGYHGVAHLDMRVERTTGRPFVIECNPRLWGSLLYSVWAGVNFPLLGARLAMGADPSAGFRPVTGECLHTGIAPRRLLGALLRGKLVPSGLSPSSRRSWIFNLMDPLPQVAERLGRSALMRRCHKIV